MRIMKARDIFALAIKIIGFIVLLQGLKCLVESLMLLQGYAHVRLSTPGYWAVWGLIKIVVGVYLLMANTPFPDLAFLREPETPITTSAPTPGMDASNLGKGNGGLMEPKVIFSIIVKTFGLILVLYGLSFVVERLLDALKSSDARAASEQNWTVYGLAAAAAGLALMRGLVPLVDWAFPEPTPTGPPEPEERAGHNENPNGKASQDTNVDGETPQG